MSGSAGKVALVASTTALNGSLPVEQACRRSRRLRRGKLFRRQRPGSDAPERNGRHPRGRGAADTNDNAADFFEDSPNPHNSSGIPPTASGRAAPAAVSSGATTLLMVTVTPGSNPENNTFVVTGDLTSIEGAPHQTFFDDGTNGDATSGDRVFSYRAAVPGGPGFRLVTATVTDGLDRTATATIRLAVEQTTTLPIRLYPGIGVDLDLRRRVRDDRRRRDRASIERLLHPDAGRAGRSQPTHVGRPVRLYRLRRADAGGGRRRSRQR